MRLYAKAKPAVTVHMVVVVLLLSLEEDDDDVLLCCCCYSVYLEMCFDAFMSFLPCWACPLLFPFVSKIKQKRKNWLQFLLDFHRSRWIFAAFWTSKQSQKSEYFRKFHNNINAVLETLRHAAALLYTASSFFWWPWWWCQILDLLYEIMTKFVYEGVASR